MKSTSITPEMGEKSFTYTPVVACIGGLFAFGVVYDRVSHWALNQKWGESKSSLFVVVGVAVTVTAMAPLIGWRAVRWLFWGFLASGIPMVFGQLHRHHRNQLRAEARMKEWS